MEELVILDADGRPVKDRQRSKDAILLGEANGTYMDCSRESVAELRRKIRAFGLQRNMQAHPEVWRYISTGLLSVTLAGFENPYDEINNLLLKFYTNTLEAQGGVLQSL